MTLDDTHTLVVGNGVAYLYLSNYIKSALGEIGFPKIPTEYLPKTTGTSIVLTMCNNIPYLGTIGTNSSGGFSHRYFPEYGKMAGTNVEAKVSGVVTWAYV